jgi:phage portal protein BeeE
MGGRRFAREAICAALGVPAVLFNLEGATYANLSTALLALWTMGANPILELILSYLNLELAPEYGADVSIVADTSQVDALLPLLRERWDVAAIAAQRGLSVDQLTSLFGLGVSPFPGSETGFVAAAQQPVDLFSVGGTS